MITSAVDIFNVMWNREDPKKIDQSAQSYTFLANNRNLYWQSVLVTPSIVATYSHML